MFPVVYCLVDHVYFKGGPRHNQTLLLSIVIEHVRRRFQKPSHTIWLLNSGWFGVRLAFCGTIFLLKIDPKTIKQLKNIKKTYLGASLDMF